MDITLDDWTTNEELFHYELAVLCPSHFNATFYLPHRALVDTNNRTFLVTLDDTEQRYQVLLTAVGYETRSEEDQEHWSEGDDDDDDDDDEKLKDVLLITAGTLFCCMIFLLLSSIVVTLRLHKSSSTRRRFLRDSRWKAVIGVFVLLRLSYSLAFTFTAALTTCRFVATQYEVNVVSGEDLIARTVKTTTSRLLRRLAELERLGGLSALEGHSDALRRLHSSVVACREYVDDLLTSTVVQIARGSSLSHKSCVWNPFELVCTNFLINVTDYIQSKKVQLGAVVARSVVKDVDQTLSDLLDNDWLRYARYLFQLKSTLLNNRTLATSAINISRRSQEFAAFLEVDGELNAAERWTSALSKRYISLFMF